jgi:uncharacterized protein (DUF58 family)
MLKLAETDLWLGFRERARKRWLRWINRRIPPARTVTLDQRRIFIFPNSAGFGFLLVLAVMLLAAINYQNNMAFALTFLLANLFVIAVLHTFANMAGLTIHAVRATPVFAGQHSEFEIMFSRSSKRHYYGIHAGWKGGDSVTVSLTRQDEVHAQLFVESERRGWHNPGRLLLETVYPLGLLRTWTWVDLDIHALVYPRPMASGPLAGIRSDKPDGSSVPVPGSDDFYGLRDYQRGDSLRHVSWKSVAKGQPLQTKHYTAYADRSIWLDWALFEGLPAERRLSHLCYWVLELDQANEEYGLRLPGVVVPPGFGDQHRQVVLRHLALYGIEP